MPDLVHRIHGLVKTRSQSTKTLSENIIFLMNRSLDSTLKCQLASFTRIILEDSTDQDFFYSNDVVILLDIIIREIQSMDDEKLLHEFIYLLPLLIKQYIIQSNSPMKDKKAEIVKSLQNILSGDCSMKLKKCIVKILENEYLKD